ncbi:MAG TPA: STAS domain-containing protein [Kiritimatiellia bacterium]|nr:STAS domain-containing protein [Kiritimatiellia bacterium]
MRECQIKLEQVGDVDVVHLDGALDAYSFPRLEKSFGELKEQGRMRILLECSHLDYINSASLGALIGYARKAREAGGDLKLAGLSPKIMSIVELLGFDKILQIYPDSQLAISKFTHA